MEGIKPTLNQIIPHQYNLNKKFLFKKISFGRCILYYFGMYMELIRNRKSKYLISFEGNLYLLSLFQSFVLTSWKKQTVNHKVQVCLLIECRLQLSFSSEQCAIILIFI